VTGPPVAKAGADLKMGERLWDPASAAERRREAET